MVRVTVVLWLLLAVHNILDKAIIVLIPFIAEDSKQALSDLPIFYSMELLSPWVACAVIDRREVGRKRGLQAGYVCCFAALLLMYFLRDNAVVVCISFQRFA